MKRMLFCFVLFAFARYGWAQTFQWQNALPQTNHVMDMYFFNAANGIAVGTGNAILKTTDGGVSWSQVIPAGASSAAELRRIFFSDANNGWIVGATVIGFTGPVILNTTDGGATWTSKTSGAPGKLQGVFFRSSTLGWVVGDDGKISKTTNGGISWSAQTSGTTNHLYEVYFQDDSVGFVFGDLGQIRKTTNGGTSWTFVTNPMSKVLAYQFLNKDTGYVAGTGGKIAKTTNGGATWNALAIGSSDDVTAIHFFDFANGWAARNNGKIYRTTNYGITWTDLGYVIGGFSSTYQLNAINFSSLTNGSTAGNAGTMFRTTDGGTTWIPAGGGTRTDLDGITFINKDLGLVVGSTNAGAFIGRTTNGGVNWNFKSAGGKGRAVFMANQNYAWYAGDNGLVYKSTNGGNSWNAQSANFSLKIGSISFSDTSNGWMAGENANAVRTTDGGATWTNLTFTATTINALNSSVVIRSTNGIIYRSGNNGTTWDSTNGRGTKISFVDTSNGWSLNGSEVMLTIDGGRTWTKKSLPLTFTMNTDIKFATKKHGWVVGTGGVFLRTTDGGNTWEQQYVKTGNDLRGVTGIDSVTVWISGTNGTILGPKSGIVTSVAHRKGTVAPSDYLLSQNFPNPFNPSTTIDFLIAQDGFVSLKVYDAVGREVKTLVYQMMNAGSYRTTFNGEGLASGLYFYRLKSGTYSGIKKMLLVK